MIWLAVLLIIGLPLAVWMVLVQEDALHERRRAPMGWLRRFWARPTPDRRHHHRYRAAIPLTYRVLEVSGAAMASVTRDVSLGGLGVVLYEKLPLGTALECTLRCDPPMAPLVVQGVVQWVREVPQQVSDPRRQFWAGIQLTHTKVTNLDQLRAMLQRISPDGKQGRV